MEDCTKDGRSNGKFAKGNQIATGANQYTNYDEQFLKKYLCQWTQKACDKLVNMLDDKELPQRDLIKVIEIFFDRVHGKPTQHTVTEEVKTDEDWLEEVKRVDRERLVQ